MVIGAGSFAQSTLEVLKSGGCEGATCLTREIGRYPASLVGEVFQPKDLSNELERNRYDLVIPMSVDWVKKPGGEDVLRHGIPVFGPPPKGLRIERDRRFAMELGREYGIRVPDSQIARNRLEAEAFIKQDRDLYVLKNPLCSPSSPIQAIVSQTRDETEAWLGEIDYAEGVFLQEYMGQREAGHVAFVSDGKVYPVVTNQEYKRCYEGNMGSVAGAPLGGIVEADPDDKYGLVRELIEPLSPWFKEVGYHGPIQVTAAKKRGHWHVLEYNARIGVTSGPLILRMLKKPFEVLNNVAQNESIEIDFQDDMKFGASVSLAGYGFPYSVVPTPPMPIELTDRIECDLWWNQVTPHTNNGHLISIGQRIADVNATGETLEEALHLAYQNIKRIRCGGSYYRQDIGKSLWPPGKK